MEVSSDAGLAELRADVRNLAAIVNEMRVENKDWREKQLKIFETMAESRKEIETAQDAIRTLWKDVDALKAWRWYLAGGCGVVAFVVAKIFS